MRACSGCRRRATTRGSSACRRRTLRLTRRSCNGSGPSTPPCARSTACRACTPSSGQEGEGMDASGSLGRFARPGWLASAVAEAARRPRAVTARHVRPLTWSILTSQPTARSVVGNRHHVRSDRSRVPVSGCRSRRAKPQYCRLVDGSPSAHRADLDALDAAVARRRPCDLIHYSDQGSHYTSLCFGWRCRGAGVRPSMGGAGTGSVGVAAGKPAEATWATPTTTRCARASSPRSSARCWRGAGSRPS